MKKLLLLICIFFIAKNSIGQSPSIEWQNTYGGLSYERALCIQKTFDGGYIFTGYTYSNDDGLSTNHGRTDCYVVKLDSNGNIQWQKLFGELLYDYGYSIYQTKDSGYIIGGTENSHNRTLSTNNGGYDAWLIKLDKGGNLVWQKCLGGSGDDKIACVRQTSDGGYIFAGVTGSNDGDVLGNHGGKYDYWVVKTNSLGVIKWQKCFGGSGIDSANSIQNTIDGGYIVAGSTTSKDGDVVGNHGKNDYWILKLKSNGIIVWKKCFGGTAADEESDVQQTKDGGYVIAGYTESTDGDVTFNHGNADYWVIKTNKRGKTQWQRSFGGSLYEYAKAIQQTSDGGYIITGSANSYDGDVSGNHSGFNSDFWDVKTDSLCNLQWETCFGGTNPETSYSVLETLDKGYINAGVTSSFNGDVSNNIGGDDCWILKLKTDIILSARPSKFSATKKANSVLLTWQTANETNSDHFVIEKNINNNWTELSAITCKGSSNSYLYEDIQPLHGYNLYRLKQVDTNNNTTYSNAVDVYFESLTAIRIYPNPVKSNLYIGGFDNKSRYEIEILNMKGAVLNKNIIENVSSYNWNAESLSNGLYYLLITSKNEMLKIKFLKQL